MGIKEADASDIYVRAALVFARIGDTDKATKIADKLEKPAAGTPPAWLPTIRAAIEISNGNPGRAIELLEGTAALEAHYVRGQAYLLLDEGRKAEAECQEFLRRDEAEANPLHAAAYLGLARAYRLQARAAQEATLYLIGPPQGGYNESLAPRIRISTQPIAASSEHLGSRQRSVRCRS